MIKQTNPASLCVCTYCTSFDEWSWKQSCNKLINNKCWITLCLLPVVFYSNIHKRLLRLRREDKSARVSRKGDIKPSWYKLDNVTGINLQKLAPSFSQSAQHVNQQPNSRQLVDQSVSVSSEHIIVPPKCDWQRAFLFLRNRFGIYCVHPKLTKCQPLTSYWVILTPPVLILQYVAVIAAA